MGLVTIAAEHGAPSVGRMGEATIWRARGRPGIAACRSRIHPHPSEARFGGVCAAARALLDIPNASVDAPEFAPDELRRRQLAAMVAWVLAGARAQPLVLAFEDLHWADPTSLDLLKMLVERGATTPLMIVATARPEFRAPWATRSHHGVISLVPLDRLQVRQMVGAISERNALSAEAIEGVTVRTGGVPLFIEEVTRLVLENWRALPGRSPNTFKPLTLDALRSLVDITKRRSSPTNPSIQ